MVKLRTQLFWVHPVVNLDQVVVELFLFYIYVKQVTVGTNFPSTKKQGLDQIYLVLSRRVAIPISIETSVGGLVVSAGNESVVSFCCLRV